jgi:hypothetical protein
MGVINHLVHNVIINQVKIKALAGYTISAAILEVSKHCISHAGVLLFGILAPLDHSHNVN